MRPTLQGESLELADTKPSWACVWHVWTLILPRRSVDGGVIWGRVWRRHDGRRWRYKRFRKAEERS